MAGMIYAQLNNDSWNLGISEVLILLILVLILAFFFYIFRKLLKRK